MNPHAEIVHVDHPLSEAAVRMRDADVGWLLVVDGDEAVGVVTDRDIVLRCTAEGNHPNEDAIDKAMSVPIASCKENDSLACAAGIMSDERVRRLVVTDNTNQCIGMLSFSDLVLNGLDSKHISNLLTSLFRRTTENGVAKDKLVRHGRATGSSLGAPQNYSVAPKIKPGRSKDSC